MHFTHARDRKENEMSGLEEDFIKSTFMWWRELLIFFMGEGLGFFEDFKYVLSQHALNEIY